MILPYDERIVNSGEYTKYNFEHPRFIGYLNEKGQPLDYSCPLGLGGHDNNKLTAFFFFFFRMPSYNYWIQYTEGKNVINTHVEQEIAKEMIEYFRKRIQNRKVYDNWLNEDVNSRFNYDLEVFFYNCYQGGTFMDGFGQNCMILNEEEYYEKYCEGRPLYLRKINETEKEYNERKNRFFRYDYHWYKKNLMLDWYKTVIVQYMHYHLIERCQKGITTSTLRPYETFYNYLLNGFTIHQIPIMIYDSEKNQYICYKQNPLLIPDSEIRLKDEIESIIRLVKEEDRYKYYR